MVVAAMKNHCCFRQRKKNINGFGLYGHIKAAKQRTIIQQYGDWYCPLISGGPAQSPPRCTKCNSRVYQLHNSMWHYNCLCTLNGERVSCDLEEEGRRRFHGVLVKNDERDEVSDKAENTDETVGAVDDELVQRAAGSLRRQGRRHSSDVIADVTVQRQRYVIVLRHLETQVRQFRCLHHNAK